MPTDDADARGRTESLRIQSVIDALIRFDQKVSSEIAEFSCRAETAERELDAQKQHSAEAEKLVSEAWRRAEEITSTAARAASELLADADRELEERQRQLDAERLEIQRREEDFIVALRQYLVEIESAQATLLRIARRALSTAAVDLEPNRSSEGHPTHSPADDRFWSAEVASAEVAVPGGPATEDEPSGSAGQPVQVPLGQFPGMPWPMEETTDEHRLIDLRNRMDLDRLGASGGLLSRALNKRRQYGFSQ